MLAARLHFYIILDAMDNIELTFEVREKPEISQIKCVVLDYDGTLTTLRKGWDKILSAYAREKVNPGSLEKIPELEEKLLHLTDHAGGTTPKQLMSRLVAIIDHFGFVKAAPIDFYAKEYADHFNEQINDRVSNFHIDGESYVINGVRPMLKFLDEKKTINYVVTGSCTHAVTDELNKLLLDNHFKRVYGASLETIGNLKEDAIREIMDRHSLNNHEVLIVGDGSTEIKAADTLNLPSIGIASDEHSGGLCQRKRSNLLDLGAHVIIHDYSDFDKLWDWLHN